MYAQVEKPKENKSRAVGNSIGQKKSNTKQVLGFVDNRPEAKSQKNLQLKNHGNIKAHQSMNNPASNGDETIQPQIKNRESTDSYSNSAANSLVQRKANQSKAAKPYFNQPASNATQFSLQRVAQLRMDAGNGAQWHIHQEHIKLGSNVDSRVNFNGRSKKEIRKELGEKISRYGLNVGGDLAASFRECINYINANY